MKLPAPLEKLQEIKHAKWIGLIATLTINVILMVISLYINDPNVGYYILMIGLVAFTFLIPYIFGWRDGKQLAIAGIGLFLVMGAIWGPLTVHRTYSLPEPDPVSSAAHLDWFNRNYTILPEEDFVSNGVTYAEGVGIYVYGGATYALDNGDVTPYKGDIGQMYNFTITLYSNGTFTEKPDIIMAYAVGIEGAGGVFEMQESDLTDTDYSDGKDFYYATTLGKAGIYNHIFAVRFEGIHDHSLNTSAVLGPLVGPETASYGFYALVGVPSMFCNVGLLFVIIVVLYWWLGTAKEKRKTWDEALRMKEEEKEKDGFTKDDALDEKPFTCDQCGASVGADDNFCPKCGERFDEEPEGSSDRKGPATGDIEDEPAPDNEEKGQDKE